MLYADQLHLLSWPARPCCVRLQLHTHLCSRTHMCMRTHTCKRTGTQKDDAGAMHEEAGWPTQSIHPPSNTCMQSCASNSACSCKAYTPTRAHALAHACTATDAHAIAQAHAATSAHANAHACAATRHMATEQKHLISAQVLTCSIY